MTFHDKSTDFVFKHFNSNAKNGLTDNEYRQKVLKFGRNVLTKKKKRNFINRFFSAFKEPMIIVLLFGFIIAFGTNIGKFLKSGEGDFSECFGIMFAVLLSVSITLIMEGSSQKAFEALNKIYDNIAVRVIRSGRVVTVSQADVVVGDVVILESGDKIVADGRLFYSEELYVDESALTGESVPSKKDSEVVLGEKIPLAERKNCVFSGTFVTAGNGKMVVTAVGDNTEIGSIAGELLVDEEVSTPLQAKLFKLGKTITIIGIISAVTVFLISAIRLMVTGTLNFESVQDLFISCIVLIVAAVPEGLPTIVAVSLALNMIKLAKGNALIKKMTATETTGAVSVICSDKTGTLTQNKMAVVSVCLNEFCVDPENVKSDVMYQNFVCNSTADITTKNNQTIMRGSSTECALLKAYSKSNPKVPYYEYRKSYKILYRQPFSSDKKVMVTTIQFGANERKLIKGAPEKVLPLCALTSAQIDKLLLDMQAHQKKARRILCFAHVDGDGAEYIYDGYVAITDPIRKEVHKSVLECKRAGIKVKILTGDNFVTAFAVAKELNIATDESQVINATELEKLDDKALEKIIPKISVIARSTPIIKLRVVRALKNLGEVVAVTGDGINDAPAIKHADVGISMGIAGSEITKEAADIVLLDDSFATVVKAISFGRNVYKNLQRFILFQLSVNISALLFITVCAIFNMPSPFNTLQLLWVNLIMDGPPALTLGLESASAKLMNNKPVQRKDGIVGAKMFIRIMFNGVFIALIMILQYAFNFLNVNDAEISNAIFTLFILFQLFNAFNSRELGSDSIFNSIGKNKVMVVTFVSVFILHFIMVQYFSRLLGVNAMCLSSWVRVILCSSTIIVVSETYKFLYRRMFVKKRLAINKI